MVSPGSSSIVLFWMRRKLIVLLQLLRFSSPHRERPALVLMGLPKCWDGPAPHLVWDWKTWIQLEIVDAAKSQGASRLQGASALVIQTDPLAAKWGNWDLEGLVTLSRSCSQFFLPGTKILAFWLHIPHYLFTTCVCTSVARNILNVGRMSKNISSVAELLVKKCARKSRNSTSRLFSLSEQGWLTHTL